MVVSVLVSTMLLGLAPATAQDEHDKSPAASSDHSKTTYKKRKLGTLLQAPQKKAVVGGHVFKYVWKDSYPDTIIKRTATSCQDMTLKIAHKADDPDDEFAKVKVVREGKDPLTYFVEVGKVKTITFKLKVGGFFQVKTGYSDGELGVVFANGSAHCSTTNGRLS